MKSTPKRARTKKPAKPVRHRARVHASQPAQPGARVEPAQAAPVAPPPQKMKTIWYLVGLVLVAMGLVVLIAGIYFLIEPESVHTVLADLYPNVWWGGIMVTAGVIFVLTNRRATVD